MTIHILAEVSLSNNQTNDLDDTIRQLVADSHQDRGCLQYDVFKKADGYVFIEHWQDEAALKAHEATPHFQHLQKTLQTIKAQLRVEVLNTFLNSTY